MLGETRPKVFVSLGSSGTVRVLPALMAALSNFPSTSGRALPSAGLPEYTAGLLPFSETAANCRVVVSHGGSGGLYSAIAVGTPVLGIPSNADQHLSTAVLVENGAGLGVRTEEASVGRLQKVLERLLFDERFRVSARHWQRIFEKSDSSRNVPGVPVEGISL